MVYEDEKEDFNNWCANYFGPDSDEQYVFDAVEKCPVVERLRYRIAELEKDAARYRWLRNHGFHSASAELGSDLDGAPFVCFVMRVHIPEPISLPYEEQEWTACDTDVAIDAAMQKD